MVTHKEFWSTAHCPHRDQLHDEVGALINRIGLSPLLTDDAVFDVLMGSVLAGADTI